MSAFFQKPSILSGFKSVSNTTLVDDHSYEPLAQSTHKAKKESPYKPTVPYAQLITNAIESQPDKKITLNDIYNYAMDEFEYFRTAGSGWKNSIRHNLSLNKNFVRVARPVNEKGKGAYWTLASNVSESKSIRPRPRGEKSKKQKQFEEPIPAEQPEEKVYYQYQLENFYNNFDNTSGFQQIEYPVYQTDYATFQNPVMLNSSSLEQFQQGLWSDQHFTEYFQPAETADDICKNDNAFRELDWINHDQIEELAEVSQTNN